MRVCHHSSLQVLDDMKVLIKIDAPTTSSTATAPEGVLHTSCALPYAHEDVRKANREGETLGVMVVGVAYSFVVDGGGLGAGVAATGIDLQHHEHTFCKESIFFSSVLVALLNF